MTGAALCMTWHHFSWQAQHFRQMERENRNNALARGRQLCTQLSILEGRLAPFFRF